jgi:hypothetical protein
MVDGGLEKAQMSGPRAFKPHRFLNAMVLPRSKQHRV